MTFNVSGNTLNGILNQRSQDMLTANGWNVMQYAVLLHMFAQVSGLEAGELVHVIADAHIYDRHVPIVEEIIARQPYDAPKFIMDKSVTDFYAFTKDSFRLEAIRPIPWRRRSRWQYKEGDEMNLIVAVDQNWAIGKDGDQLVYLKEDLKRFRTLTSGHTVILGRKTLATFPGAAVEEPPQFDFVPESSIPGGGSRSVFLCGGAGKASGRRRLCDWRCFSL